MIGYLLVAVLGGVVAVAGWLILHPACPECGIRRPVGRYVVGAVLLGLVLGAWLMG